jgi:hypothetical protein
MAAANVTSELFTYLIDEKNRFTINKFIYAVLRMSLPSTRLQLKIVSSGCRYWQLVIGILFVLQRHVDYNLVTILKTSEETNPSYHKLVTICKKIIRAMTPRMSLFYDFFYENIVNDLVLPFTDVNQIDEGVHYLCIYDTYNNKSMISHYFMIIKRDEQYYLSSSYGSDFVCVPYSTSILNISDFLSFVEALHHINQSTSNEEKVAWATIHYFYNTYFLKGNIPVRIDQDLRENNPIVLQHIKGTHLLQGPEIELKNVFKNNTTRYYVGIVPRYEEIIESAIPSSIHINIPSKRRKQGGRSRKRKRTIRRTCKQ